MLSYFILSLYYVLSLQHRWRAKILQLDNDHDHMLGPMEYNPIAITLPADYNRSCTHICTQSEMFTCKICVTVLHFQISLAKCPTTLMSTL